GVEGRREVLLAGFRGEDDDVDVGVGLGAYRTAHRQAVGAGHHPVEDRQARPVGREQNPLGLESVGGDHHFVAQPLERALQDTTRDEVIVGNEDLHCGAAPQTFMMAFSMAASCADNCAASVSVPASWLLRAASSSASAVCVAASAPKFPTDPRSVCAACSMTWASCAAMA